MITDKVQLPRVYMAWLTPAYFKPGDADADLLALALGGGKSSRLYKKLVYEKQIAQDVKAEQNSVMLGSIFQITATAKPGVKPEELEKAIEEELAAVQKDGITQAELERARNTIETRKIQGLQRLGGFGGVADMLDLYNHYTGRSGISAERPGAVRERDAGVGEEAGGDADGEFARGGVRRAGRKGGGRCAEASAAGVGGSDAGRAGKRRVAGDASEAGQDDGAAAAGAERSSSWPTACRCTWWSSTICRC